MVKQIEAEVREFQQEAASIDSWINQTKVLLVHLIYKAILEIRKLSKSLIFTTNQIPMEVNR